MDPVSITTAILAFLATAKQVEKYVSDVKNANKERDRLLIELRGLKAYLKLLAARLEIANAEDPWFKGLQDALAKQPNNGQHEPDGILVQIDEFYKDVDAMLNPEHCLAWKRLTWSWDKATVDKKLAKIDRIKGLIESILRGDEFALSTATYNNTEVALQDTRVLLQEVSTIATLQESEKREKEREAILDWLSPIRAHERHGALISGAAPIGQAFLGSEEFMEWESGQGFLTLICSGVPGAGKTLTSAITVRHLQQQSKGKNVPVIFLYLNHKEKEKQTLENLLGSLLKQLIQCDESLPLSEDVKKIYLNSKKEARPSSESLIEVLKVELQRFAKAFLIVDALDESEEATGFQLLNSLEQLLSKRTKLMVTQRLSEGAQESQCYHCKLHSRNRWNCKDCHMDLCLSCKGNGLTCHDASHELSASRKTIELNIRVPDREIAAYVDWDINKLFKNTTRMTTFGRLCYNDPQLRKDILAIVVEKAGGMILLAKRYMDSLKLKLTLQQVKEALQTLPIKLEDTYVEAMQRIDAQQPEAAALARKVLSWLVYTRRPLSLIELQHVLAVDERDKDFNYDAIFDKKTILSRCASLVIVDTDELAVRLFHLTVQEYFDRDPEKHFPGAVKEIGVTCLTYLSFASFKEPREGCKEDISVSQRLEKFPFLRYGSVYWGEHVQDAISETVIVEKALRFVSDKDRLSSAIQSAYYTHAAGTVSWDVRKGVNGLHVCAWFGLDVLIRGFLFRDHDVNSQDGRGQTALMYACRRGHASTVTLLLESGADVNIRSAPESTAMFEALAQNHTKVMEVLLRCDELDINAIQPHKHSRTALMLASSASEEREDVVECLLSRSDIDVNKQDLYGYTALSLAAEMGYYKITETLLNRKDTEGNRVVDVNSVNKTGSTALSLAAAAGETGIVELLLDHHADTSIRDLEGGGTALMRAVDNGYIDIVEIMINSNANIHVVDDLGRSLLHSASINGWPDIVKFLVNMEDGLDPNLRDRNGRTALHDTARTGQPDVTKLLLELGAEATLKDKSDRTPYTVARQHGERRVMLILEGKPDITDPALLSNLGPIPDASSLPVWSLAGLGLMSVLQNMITGEGLGPNRNSRFAEGDPDSNDTGLHNAISSSHPDILSLLVSQYRIPINAQNDYGRTPLHFAALYGSLECISILLEQPDINLDLEDIFSTTPLISAQQCGYFDICVALISAGCTINPLETQIQGLFFRAAELANVKAVEFLIEKGADVLSKNLDGMTALQITKEALKEAEIVAGQAEGDDEAENENTDMVEEIDRRKELREVLQLLQNNKSFYRPLRTNNERLEESTSVRSSPKVTLVTSPQLENENGGREFAFRPRPPVVLAARSRRDLLTLVFMLSCVLEFGCELYSGWSIVIGAFLAGVWWTCGT